MTPENEVVAVPPAAERVGLELSRWFGSGDFATRAKGASAASGRPRPESAQRVDWARVLPFLATHAVCLAVIWVGFSWVALGVTVALYVLRMFAITGFYHRYFSHRTFKTSHVFGRQRYQTGDASRNKVWLAIITLGEGWHNNHHHYPASVRQGFYWWEFDITFYMLKLLSFCGLIWDLKPVPAAVREGAGKRY